MPASTVAVSNTTGRRVAVTITGGTLTNVSVNGSTVGAGAGTYSLPAGGTITMTYSVAPTWSWANLLDVGYGWSFGAQNTGALTGSGHNALTELPMASHTTGGLPGLAVGVAN